MIRWLAINLLILFLITGCGIHVVPRSVPGASINPADNSITVMKNNITVTARVQDLEFGPYTGQNNITTFYVVIQNGSMSDINFSLDSFLLLDENSQQYRPLEPEKVKSYIKKELDYLIPYPYVGYYYLQDKEQFDYDTLSSSSMPYTGYDRTIDVDAEALHIEPIIPGAKISGMLYFNIDLYLKRQVDFKIRITGGADTDESEMTFPFMVEK